MSVSPKGSPGHIVMTERIHSDNDDRMTPTGVHVAPTSPSFHHSPAADAVYPSLSTPPEPLEIQTVIHESSESQHDDDDDENNNNNLLAPLVVPVVDTSNSTDPTFVRSRRTSKERRRLNKRTNKGQRAYKRDGHKRRSFLFSYCCPCCHDRVVRSIQSLMNLLAKLLFWGSVVAMAGFVVWYSYELSRHGTDPHLIAWFSAGAFVLLGFPISMYGIVMHLSNYNAPHIQCYIVRILWMVPIYSFESWLCLRFHHLAIYIETLRDCYESYVLYCFLQFLIQVLGGEEELIYLLKDKSPTRGVHMWGLQWCVKPWLMGVPVSRKRVVVPVTTTTTTTGSIIQTTTGTARSIKHVQWTSPFFVKCKVGVLQYVLLKFVSSIMVMVLELHGLYKEGDFTYRGGYLYICILTNLSQCWALYCLIFFYYATKNELAVIRPVGKFLSVKALVFFTWWQSVGISLLYQMDMIPHYQTTTSDNEWTSEDVAKGLQDYLICIEMFIAAIVHVFVFPHTDYTAEAVAARVASRNYYKSGASYRRVLGRKGKGGYYHRGGVGGDDRSVSSKNSANDYDLELASQGSSTHQTTTTTDTLLLDSGPPFNDTLLISNKNGLLGDLSSSEHDTTTKNNTTTDLARAPSQIDEEDEYEEEDDDDDEYDMVPDSPIQIRPKTGFVKALLDSTIPRDVVDDTAGMVKGEYVVQRKTLLHHAATSDQYDLFSSARRFQKKKDEKGQS